MGTNPRAEPLLSIRVGPINDEQAAAAAVGGTPVHITLSPHGPILPTPPWVPPLYQKTIWQLVVGTTTYISGEDSKSRHTPPGPNAADTTERLNKDGWTGSLQGLLLLLFIT